MSIYKGTTLIAGSLPNAANQDLSNLSQTGQAVIDGKADTDLANVTNTGKVLMSGMGMPSDTYVDLTLGASGSTYTAPANGWFTFSKKTNNTNQYIFLKGSLIGSELKAPNSGSGLTVFLPVQKGDSIRVGYNAGGGTDYFRFIYAVGSESEA